MKQLRCFAVPALVAALFSAWFTSSAQQPVVRLKGPITEGSRVALTGSRPPWAKAASDLGAVPADMKLENITLVFRRSEPQQAALDALLAAQQNPASAQYHRWLTPEAFAAQFGVADADLGRVQSWLQEQGFGVQGVARSRDRINFSGTAGQVASAFGADLHRYRFGSETHFGPSADLSLPQTLAPLVTAVLHLSDLRLKPQIKLAPARAVRPALTSSISQNHYLTPKDVATMYDVNSLYNAGYTGTGQSLAIVGQSFIQTSDIEKFQSAAGLPGNLPVMVLVPNTGVSQTSYGDEGESDLDVEYSTGMAPNAAVYFVYVGNNSNDGVLDSLDYAITEDIAPVVSISYGGCEPLQTASYVTAQDDTFQEAAAQGQTIIASAGDEGSTECSGETDGNGNPVSTSIAETPAVVFPADSPAITSMGGTQMAPGTFTSGNTTYWAAANGADVISSLLSYVPEVVWNEDSPDQGLTSGGGGASILFPRPTWQAGVPGIPSGTARLEPDISLQSSVASPGYALCTSDPETLAEEGLTSSCDDGFRSAGNQYLTIAGGTSFSAPIFAGLMAILNSAKNSTGQGNINPILYGLAANPATYASAFHDITTGNNDCEAAGSTYCGGAGETDYPAGTGYDEATGLGTIDFANLVTAWPSGTAAGLTPTTVEIQAPFNASGALTPGQSAQLNLTVASAAASTTGGALPTGTVTISLDGTVLASGLPLMASAVNYTFTVPSAAGTHVITVAYSGDSNFAPSAASTAFTLGDLEASGSFTLTAGSITVPNNSTGSSTVTVTPSAGYAGTVVFSVTSSAAVPSDICYGIAPVAASSAANATTLVFGEGAVCSSAEFKAGAPGRQVMAKHAAVVGSNRSQLPWRGRPATALFAGLLAIGFAGWRRRSRRFPLLLLSGLLAAASVGLSGCGGSGSSQTSTPTPTTSTYTLTLTGMDSVNTSITSSTTFTLTVQ